MLNIEATLNGEDYSSIVMPREQYSYEELKLRLREVFTISTDKRIEVFDEQDNELGSISMPPKNNSKKLQVALINKRYQSAIGDCINEEPGDEESNEQSSVIKDEISKNKYS
jgi:hypothetical protein